jgi:hypothetical protein
VARLLQFLLPNTASKVACSCQRALPQVPTLITRQPCPPGQAGFGHFSPRCVTSAPARGGREGLGVGGETTRAPLGASSIDLLGPTAPLGFAVRPSEGPLRTPSGGFSQNHWRRAARGRGTQSKRARLNPTPQYIAKGRLLVPESSPSSPRPNNANNQSGRLGWDWAY